MQPHLEIKTNYENRIFFIRYYFNKLINTAIKMAKFQPNETILDFGCGNQYLKHKLPQHNIIGYDIIPEMSDVENYRSVHPDVIFANSVFEHLTAEELHKTLQSFNQARLITITPVENILARILVTFVPSVSESWDDHKLNHKQIHKIIKRYYSLKKEKTILTEAKVAVWIRKPQTG
ncbi:MAG: class I SAM-dependent methyltransferase [Nanoarchaeota archaeon]|nr:class I SAM-dependent methyltransferase [Nanoarchaeota archaeon]